LQWLGGGGVSHCRLRLQWALSSKRRQHSGSGGWGANANGAGHVAVGGDGQILTFHGQLRQEAQLLSTNWHFNTTDDYTAKSTQLELQ